jgi:hypothetical protein
MRTGLRVLAQARSTGARPTRLPPRVGGSTGILSKSGSWVPGKPGYVSCASLMSAQLL